MGFIEGTAAGDGHSALTAAGYGRTEACPVMPPSPAPGPSETQAGQPDSGLQTPLPRADRGWVRCRLEAQFHLSGGFQGRAVAPGALSIRLAWLHVWFRAARNRFG